MARYSMAAALLLLTSSVVRAHEGPDVDAWSYLPVKLDTPLSDMSLTVLSTNSTDGEVTKRIIITGGCDSEKGNEYVEADWGEGFSCFGVTNKAYSFDPIRNNKFQAWNGDVKAIADMPRTRNRHASAVVSGHVCVFGGRNETDAVVPEVDCWDPDSDTWSTPTSLPDEHHSSDFTAFTEDNLVYLIGGYDANYTALEQMTVMDMSNFNDITYSFGSTLKSARGDIDVAVIDKHVYVSGGFTDENYYEKPLNSVERYDMETKTWSNVDSLNEERGDKQLVALNGKVYALGGEAKVDVSGIPKEELPALGARSEVLDSIEVFDPTEDVHGGLAEWRSLAGMPGQLFRFAASEWEVQGEEDGYIFVFGGQIGYNADCNCFATTDQIMVFDIAHAEKEEEEVEKESETKSGGLNVGGYDMIAVRTLSFVVASLLLLVW